MISHRRLAIAACALLLAGCNRPADVSWKERVLLNDGSQVELARSARRNNVWPLEIGQGCCAVTDESFHIVGSNVEWHRASSGIVYASLPQQPVSVTVKTGIIRYQPFSINRVNGEYVIAAHPDVSDALLNFCLANPSLYNVFFLKWKDGRWELIPQSSELLDSARRNLLGTNWIKKKSGDLGIVTWREVSEPAPAAQKSVRQYLEDSWLSCKSTAALSGRKI